MIAAMLLIATTLTGVVHDVSGAVVPGATVVVRAGPGGGDQRTTTGPDGRFAIDISAIPRTHLDHPFEKTGPGHRCDFSEEFVEEFARWLKTSFKVGVHGPPCKPHSELKLPKCPAKVRRKGCMV